MNVELLLVFKDEKSVDAIERICQMVRDLRQYNPYRTINLIPNQHELIIEVDDEVLAKTSCDFPMLTEDRWSTVMVKQLKLNYENSITMRSSRWPSDDPRFVLPLKKNVDLSKGFVDIPAVWKSGT